jgi:hypothetical protein
METMRLSVRTLFLSAVLALSACGEPATPGARARDPGAVVLGSTQNLPDWLLVARQRDCARDAPEAERCPLGEIHFNQRTITRNGDGTADIWIQARHGQPQLFQIESETLETTVRFDVERLHYRFNCSTEEFVVIERQIMGAGETVVAQDAPRQIYRAPVRGSVTGIILPIACRGA